MSEEEKKEEWDEVVPEKKEEKEKVEYEVEGEENEKIKNTSSTKEKE